MASVIEKSGKDIEEALQAALKELGASKADVEVEVLENPSKGLFFGIGAKPAKIRVTLKDKTESEEEEVSEPEPVEVVEEEISQVEENIFDREKVISDAKNFLADVFAAMNVNAEINIYSDESDEVIFDLVGKNMGVLIGKHGQTLDALQYLVNLSANKFNAEQKLHFILDVENYRQRRTESLENLAKGVAQQVSRTHKEIKLEPMNRHERRVIHTALQDNNRVETQSFGEEPYRYIVVSPKKRSKK